MFIFSTSLSCLATVQPSTKLFGGPFTPAQCVGDPCCGDGFEKPNINWIFRSVYVFINPNIAVPPNMYSKQHANIFKLIYMFYIIVSQYPKSITNHCQQFGSSAPAHLAQIPK